MVRFSCIFPDPFALGKHAGNIATLSNWTEGRFSARRVDEHPVRIAGEPVFRLEGSKSFSVNPTSKRMSTNSMFNSSPAGSEKTIFLGIPPSVNSIETFPFPRVRRRFCPRLLDTTPFVFQSRFPRRTGSSTGVDRRRFSFITDSSFGGMLVAAKENVPLP